MDVSKSYLQQILLDESTFPNVELFVVRDDLIHPEVSGNKWRKLKLNLKAAQDQKKTGILTFGGAYSNHLLATASACQMAGLKSVGIVRGDELSETSNHNLKRCAELGMQLIFFPRTAYQQRTQADFQAEWSLQYSDFMLVPEGGANKAGILGCTEIWDIIDRPMDHLFVAQGTSTTSCGLVLGNPNECKIHVVPVLKGYDSLSEMNSLFADAAIDASQQLKQVVVHADGHFGGYAKSSDELTNFMCYCKDQLHLPLDRIYTGKAFFTLYKWLSEHHFLTPTRVVFIHTGGLLNA